MDSRKILRALTEMKLRQNDNVLQVGGFSMIPLLVAGDNIRIKKQDKYEIGDIVVCVDYKNDKVGLLVHRIIHIRKKDGKIIYIIKGDNAVAAEFIESEFCLGKVTEITNRNGKKIQVNTPSKSDDEIVSLSRQVYQIYQKTGDPIIAFSSAPHMEIYDKAPDYLKESVFAAQKEMIKRAAEMIQGLPPSPPDPNFEFTKDFYLLLAFHRVMNVLEPYVIEGSGRFGKHIKLSKARNLMSARKRMVKAKEIVEAFEEKGIKYIVFKGLASSYFIFGDPNIRECDDIDFLILPEDVQKAHTILGELGYSYHDERGFFRPEEPEEHYRTHLKPYVHEKDLNTVELHTAIFTDEKYTAAVLENRQKININGMEVYVLKDVEAFVCQLFITAVDDYGTANMTYEMDPNIFLQLKFRNYLDIAMMAKKCEDISAKEVIETAMKYDVNFQMFFALDFTCKIFDYAAFTEPLRKLRDKFIENEQLEPNMYFLPVGIQDCLRSPFKMKMNGRVLCYLRDGYIFSSHWRRVQSRIETEEIPEMKQQVLILPPMNGVVQKLKRKADGVVLDVEIDGSEMPEEFIFVVKNLLKEKCRKPEDYAYEVCVLYVNKSEGYMRRGRIMQNMHLDMEELTDEVMGYVHKRHRKSRKCLKLAKKQTFVADSENQKIKTKFKFAKETFLFRNGISFMAYSMAILELKEGKLNKTVPLHAKEENIIKISFD